MERDYYDAITRKKVSNERLRTKYIIKALYLLFFFLSTYAACCVAGASLAPNQWDSITRTCFIIIVSVCFICTTTRD